MKSKEHEYVIRFLQETPMGLSSTHEYDCNIYTNNVYNAGRSFKAKYKKYFDSESAYKILEWRITHIDGKPVDEKLHVEEYYF